MDETRSAFWDDLDQDLQDPQYRREYILEAQRIATIDRIVNALRDAGRGAGLPKQAVAEAARMSAPALRRLLSAPAVNPTLSTLSDVAAALGLKVALVPMSPEERKTVTGPLIAEVSVGRRGPATPARKAAAATSARKKAVAAPAAASKSTRGKTAAGTRATGAAKVPAAKTAAAAKVTAVGRAASRTTRTDA
jgi:DNA-binding phage protein